jgi:hypothetical protein
MNSLMRNGEITAFGSRVTLQLITQRTQVFLAGNARSVMPWFHRELREYERYRSPVSEVRKNESPWWGNAASTVRSCGHIAEISRYPPQPYVRTSASRKTQPASFRRETITVPPGGERCRFTSVGRRLRQPIVLERTHRSRDQLLLSVSIEHLNGEHIGCRGPNQHRGVRRSW